MTDMAKRRSRMNWISSGALVLGTAVGSVTPAHALEVDKVQLALKDSGDAACPRNATATVWAHTDGPGPVKVLIRNRSGGAIGIKTAQAVKGSGGNYLATVKNQFTITTGVKIHYRAYIVWQFISSYWVSFYATFFPQVRSTTSTKFSSSGPMFTKVADNEKPSVRKKISGTTKSGSGPRMKKAKDVPPATKPAPYKGEDVCHITQIPGHYASAARLSKAKERAIRQWAGEVARVKGSRWNDWTLAKNTYIDCGAGFATIKKCIAYAVPCLSRRSSTKTKPVN